MSKAKKVLPYGEQIVTGDADSILSGLYRALLFNGNVQAHQFERFLVNYIQKIHKEATNIRDRTSLKASLYKELMADRLSWRVFIKGLRILNLDRFDISIRVYSGKHIVEVNKSIMLSDIEEKEKDDDDRSGNT